MRTDSLPISLLFAYAWRNMLARKFSTAVTALAVAAAVLVFIVVSATASGIRNVAANTGSPDNVIVMSKGATSAEASVLDRATLNSLREVSSVARGATGEPLVSVELLLGESIPSQGIVRSGKAVMRYVTVRGITPTALAVHRGVHVTAGRLPHEPGELIIGRLVPATLGHIRTGDNLTFAGRRHRVVGTFEAGGQVFEGEIWADLDDMRNESGRRGASTAVLRAPDAAHVATLLAQIEASRTVRVEARSEPAYYANIRQASAAFMYLGNVIAVIMGAGAVAAGTNTMYAAMSRRVREMGTLRALGFGRHLVGGLVLLESCLVAAVGGLIGACLALAFDGYALNLLGLSFELDVSPASLAAAAALAFLIGFGGGALPARAASGLDIVQALRHT